MDNIDYVKFPLGQLSRENSKGGVQQHKDTNYHQHTTHNVATNNTTTPFDISSWYRLNFYPSPYTLTKTYKRTIRRVSSV